MKRVLILAVVFATPSMHGAILGWLTSQARDWQFVQQSGGIRVGTPIEKDGRRVVPVEYWPEGNSGLAVRKIDLKKHGVQLVIRVFTQVAEKGSDTARVHHV